METLRELLDNEKTNNTLKKFAQDFGYKSDSIKLVFNKYERLHQLHLLVEIEDRLIGCENYNFMLEAKLIALFNIDVVVYLNDATSEMIQDSIFSLDACESRLPEFLNRDLNDVKFKSPAITNEELEENLELAASALERISALKESKVAYLAKQAVTAGLDSNNPEPLKKNDDSHASDDQASTSSSTTVTSDSVTDFLAPDNKSIAEETLRSLPNDVIDTLFSIFSAKKRQLQSLQKPTESKSFKSDDSQHTPLDCGKPDTSTAYPH